MSRDDKLRALEELQKVDLKIRDLAQQAERHPARLKQIEGGRDDAKAALDAQRGRLADNERARRQNEQLLQLEKEKVRKWESRLSELKTTREYAALARELDIAKKTNEGAEEEIRRLAGEYEEIRKGLAEMEKQLAEKDAVVASEGKQIHEDLAGVRASMEELENRLKDIFQARTDKTIFVKAAGKVPYGKVVQAMDIARGAGVERIGIISESQTADAANAAGAAAPTNP